MRRIIFPFVIVLISTYASFAQNRFAISAGATMSNFSQKDNDEKVDGNKFKPGITVGVSLDVPMEKHGSFQPGVFLVQKGSKSETVDGSDVTKVDTRLNYIEVPLNVVFRIPCSSGRVVLGGGPAVGFALSGKSKVDGTGTDLESDLKFGSSSRDADLNFIDFGINALAGYEFSSGFFVNASYTHGINNLILDAPEGNKLWNRVFALRLGFMLGGKAKPAAK
ncbi:MAG: PorT family protein [Chitinophagaceae bacterium]|nr:PorT family protein [Chitinophagaceae bacterium]